MISKVRGPYIAALRRARGVTWAAVSAPETAIMAHMQFASFALCAFSPIAMPSAAALDPARIPRLDAREKGEPDASPRNPCRV